MSISGILPGLPIIGGGQLSFVQSARPDFLASAAFPTANAAVLCLVRVARPITVTSVKVFVGTASGNLDVGVYQSDGTTATRLAASGSTAAAGTNAIQSINLTAPVTFVPGIDYYLVIAADNTTVTLGRASVTAAIAAVGKQAMQVATSFPLPTSITIGATGTTSMIWMYAS